MRRTYTDVSAFRAPYSSSNISFAGLGSDGWPAGRSYQSVHFYRAPYQAGYYQSGALRGTGATESSVQSTVPPLAGLLLGGVLIFGTTYLLMASAAKGH